MCYSDNNYKERRKPFPRTRGTVMLKTYRNVLIMPDKNKITDEESL